MSRYDAYIAEVTNELLEYHWLRVGQAYFNVLEELFPRIADEVRSGPLDPFYNDDAIPSFLTWLQVTYPAIF